MRQLVLFLVLCCGGCATVNQLLDRGCTISVWSPWLGLYYNLPQSKNYDEFGRPIQVPDIQEDLSVIEQRLIEEGMIVPEDYCK